MQEAEHGREHQMAAFMMRVIPDAVTFPKKCGDLFLCKKIRRDRCWKPGSPCQDQICIRISACDEIPAEFTQKCSSSCLVYASILPFICNKLICQS